MTSTTCMKALCLAGRIILENGGETYRAEDTVRRMARALGLREADAFAIPSGLFISFNDELFNVEESSTDIIADSRLELLLSAKETDVLPLH